MRCLFRDQPTVFAACTPGVFLRNARHPHDANHPRLAAPIRHQCTKQKLAVDAIRLRPPCALLHRDAGRIEHEAGDSSLRQQAVQPEPVITGLVAAHHLGPRSKLARCPVTRLLDQLQQASMVAALELMTRNPIFGGTVHGRQPASLAQFDRNENRAIMPVGGRALGRCLHLPLRWFESGNPNLSLGTLTAHGIYEFSLGFSASRSQSPSRLMASDSNTSTAPGMAEIHQSPENRNSLPIRTSDPSEGVVGGTPMPRKLNVASVRIASARLMVAITTIGPSTFGRICDSMMRSGPTPMTRAAST